MEMTCGAQEIKSLQYMLNRLARDYDALIPVTVDGRFGAETLEAVMRFQREFHPPVTGLVDQGTWTAIRDRWEESEAKDRSARSSRIFPSGDRQVTPGEEQEYLILPQAMFQLLGRYFEGIVSDPADGIHGAESAQNVRWLQRAAGQPENGILERETWDLLSRLYEMTVVRDKTPRLSGGWG